MSQTTSETIDFLIGMVIFLLVIIGYVAMTTSDQIEKREIELVFSQENCIQYPFEDNSEIQHITLVQEDDTAWDFAITNDTKVLINGVDIRR